MLDNPSYLWQFHQIPVYALQSRVSAVLHENLSCEVITQRFSSALGFEPRDSAKACNRLSREQLFRLVGVCPEIDAQTIQELFEEFKYGKNPSLSVYVFEVKNNQLLNDLHEFTREFKQEFGEINSDVEEADAIRPTTRELQLNSDLQQLGDFPSVIEGNYRFLKRLDYIDENQEANSTYETKYGYFWIHTELGYVTVHGRNSSVVKAICSAFESVTGISLIPLVINKQFRKMLSFLRHGTIRSTKYRNPNAASGSIDSITIRGEKLDPSDLQQFDSDFPEMPFRRYRIPIDEEKISSVAVTQDGSISLSGRITALQFRNWSMPVLDEVMEVWGEFRKTPETHLETIDLESSLEFKTLRTRKKKDAFLTILVALLTLQARADDSIVQLSESPLLFAESFGQGVRVQLPFACKVESCSEEGYYKCKSCGSYGFRVVQSNGWYLSCLNSEHRSFKIPFPVIGECEYTHTFLLDTSYVESNLEIFLDSDLLDLLSTVTNKYIRNHSFDPLTEMIYLRGNTFVYHKKQPRKTSEVPPNHIENYYHANNDLNLIKSPVNTGRIVQGADNEVTLRDNGPE